MPEEMPDLPEPSAGLMLDLAKLDATFRLVERHFGKRAAREYLADIERSLGGQEATLNVVRLRPCSRDPRVEASMREARAWFAQAQIVLLGPKRR